MTRTYLPRWGEADRRQVEAWLQAGWSRGQIAAELGLSRTATSQRIMAIPHLSAIRIIKPGMPNVWSDSQRVRVASMIANGNSCGQIAAELGGLTRNAVIGRIHRDQELRAILSKFGQPKGKNLAAQKPKPKPKPKPQPPLPPAAKKSDDWGAWEDAEAIATRKAPAPAALPLPKPERRLKPLMDLVRDECRFPEVEDADVVGRYLFCCEPTLPEAVYCAHHAQRCHTPAMQRRRA